MNESNRRKKRDDNERQRRFEHSTAQIEGDAMEESTASSTDRPLHAAASLLRRRRRERQDEKRVSQTID